MQKHHETRKLDNAGCFSFGDVKYEASTALANAEVEIAYDPMNTETIKVVYQDMKPIMAHRVSIGAFCDKTVDVPVGMTDKIPETSRFLDAMEKKYRQAVQFEADRRCHGETDIRGRQAVVCGSYCGSVMWKINAYPDV